MSKHLFVVTLLLSLTATAFAGPRVSTPKASSPPQQAQEDIAKCIARLQKNGYVRRAGMICAHQSGTGRKNY
jgi:hypothetical protein